MFRFRRVSNQRGDHVTWYASAFAAHGHGSRRGHVRAAWWHHSIQASSAAPVGQGFELNASDLRFILKQIKIAEHHVANTTATTGPCGALIGRRRRTRSPTAASA